MANPQKKVVSKLEKPTPQIHIGIDEQARTQIADLLTRFLADTYTLYLKTHNFHWNVTGPHFSSLHNMLEEQYNELWTATDEIAERIRALGVFVPGSGKQFSELSSIDEETGIPDWKGMLTQLVEGHEAASRSARAVFAAADDANDQPTADLVTVRMTAHEKTAWMLRSMLQ
ncbi:Dps family protein [Coralloluteibacterium stylophorae]|uniref:DNA starvation/stationary phase protection protein n=1 Tax=Coralloluteibacterium stylophorae TaxID=1776034 RepID=A0A8J8AXF7_9GAMM|nr:Dps family protein [Coralloluteibacterium stylophorae]MBS7456761.1 DNA starvation/stationary phase protection protein [Coralloluteibacterium stylophorae]